MPIVTTTLAEIRAKNPCTDGWKKLLTFLGKTRADDEPVSLATILESNGLNDALWCLRALPARYDQTVVLFACDCAFSVLPLFEAAYPTDTRPREAIAHARQLMTEGASADSSAVALAVAWEAVAWEAATGAKEAAARAAARAVARRLVAAPAVRVAAVAARAAWAAEDTRHDSATITALFTHHFCSDDNNQTVTKGEHHETAI